MKRKKFERTRLICAAAAVAIVIGVMPSLASAADPFANRNKKAASKTKSNATVSNAMTANLKKLQKVSISAASMDKLAKRNVVLPRGLPSTKKKNLINVVREIKKGNNTAASKEWQKAISGLPRATAGQDINALIQWVMRESYIENLQDLEMNKKKVSFYNKQKQQIRDNITQMRKLEQQRTRALRGKRAPKNEKIQVKQIDLQRVPKFQSGRSANLLTKSLAMNKAQYEAYLKSLEQKLGTVGEDAQLANIEMQNSLQKSQQMLQSMSNVSKMMYDTAILTIRKIG